MSNEDAQGTFLLLCVVAVVSWVVGLLMGLLARGYWK